MTLLSSESVVDVAVGSERQLLGATVSRSAGGLIAVGNAHSTSDLEHPPTALELGPRSSAALAMGSAGDTARLGLTPEGHAGWAAARRRIAVLFGVVTLLSCLARTAYCLTQ